MRNSLTIVFAVIVAAVCSRPLMSGLQHLVLPAGQRLSVFSPIEAFAAFALFALFLCACAGLAAAVGFYLRRYSAAVRWTIVVLPMLIAGGFVTLLKAAQFRDAQAAAAILGMPSAFSLRQASFHTVPAVALAAGLLAVTVSMFLRARNGQPGAAPNGGPATPVGNSGVTEGPPSAIGELIRYRAKPMAADTDVTTNTKPKRRWPQFSLRTLLLLTVLISLFFAWIGNILIRVHHQRDIVAKIQSLGGKAYYAYQLAGEHIDAKSPPGPKIVRFFIGDDAFAHVEAVFLNYESKTTDKDLVLLTELPKLKDISLDGHDITDKGLEYVAQVPKLRGLSLTNTNVTADGLARLHSADGLVSLTLHGSTVNDDTIRQLNKLPNLQYLQLVRTTVTSAGVKHLGDLSQLRGLDLLVAASVDNDGLRHLANLTNLETLQLLDTSVSDDGLVHLRGLTHLRALVLSGTNVSDSGIEHVSALRKLTHLRLDRTKVGDAGLAQLTKLNDLESLCLTRTEVSDDGVVHLAKMSELRSLEIHWTKISGDGILRMAHLTNLETISVGPDVTKSAATQFRNSLPNCHVTCYDKNGVRAFQLP